MRLEMWCMLLVDWTGRLTVGASQNDHQSVSGVCRQIGTETLSASESPKITTVDICLQYIP